MSEYILEMRGITKRFPGTVALDKVDLTLKRGEILALIGENGAGKSTLMNVLMGNLIAEEGKIFLNNEEIVNHNPVEALHRGISMVPQELNLAQELTVAENIFLGNHVKKGAVLNWPGMYSEARKLLNQLEIDIDPHKKAKELSAAYQQLVVIARTLVAGSDIIILDEPTAALTINETQHLLNIMTRLAKEEGKSLIMITHHLDEVKAISNRICTLRDGHLVLEEETDKMSIDDMIYAMANEKITAQTHVDRTFSDENILEVRNLTRKHEFEDVSFEVKKGEIFGIAGLVGAGRTELISCIYGLTKSHGGEVIFEGQKVDIKNPIDAIRHGIGLVPEERRKDGIFPLLSVQENIMMPSYKKYTSGCVLNFKSIKDRSKEEIQALRIKTSSEENQIKNLSGGNQQKAILARWMEKNMKLLFLDEPTRGIDIHAKGEIYNLIRSMADKGLTVVIVSSEIDEILAVADRVMVMFEGHVKGFTTPDEKMSRTDILKMSLS